MDQEIDFVFVETYICGWESQGIRITNCYRQKGTTAFIMMTIFSFQSYNIARCWSLLAWIISSRWSDIRWSPTFMTFSQKIVWLRPIDNIDCPNYQPIITDMLPSVSATVRIILLYLIFQLNKMTFNASMLNCVWELRHLFKTIRLKIMMCFDIWPQQICQQQIVICIQCSLVPSAILEISPSITWFPGKFLFDLIRQL